MNGSLSWQRKVLSNGLIMLQYPRSSAMTAQLSLTIKYGSNDDSKDTLGTAHFLEHMLAGGSRKRIKLHHEIERFGGYSNFETTKDCTFSLVDVFPEKLSEASKVLSGLLFDTAFERDKVELERKVILNEIAEAYDDPRDKTAETLIKCLFKHHPVKNPILGSKKTVKHIALKELKRTHEIHYTPQNMILTLTGKFSSQDAELLLKDFQDKENVSSVSKKNRTNEESKPKKEVSMERSGINQAYLSFGLRTPPAKHVDTPQLDLVSAILGTGESSRLFVELREKRALTYDFDIMNIAGLDYGYFYISCAAKTKSLKQTQTIVQDELEKIKTRPITRSELEKSKNLLLANIYRAMDSYGQLPRLLADVEICFEDENALRQYTDKIRLLCEKDITKVANKYFQERNYATARLTPKKPEQK